MSDDELPVGWAGVSLKDVATKIVDGSHNPPAKRETGLPMLSGRNIENGRINFDDFRLISDEDFATEDARTRVSVDDVLLTIVGTIGRSAVVASDQKRFTLQRSVAVITPAGIDSKFLSLQFQAPAAQRFFAENAKGTAQKGVYLKTLAATPIQLPPLAEQKRIVAKIEELFSELEAGEESLRAARRQLGVYRQSILKQAFEGKLTETWRAENPDKLEKWTWTTVGKIGRIETGTTPPTDNQANYGGDLPFFKPTDLEQGRYVKDARSYLSASGRQSARVLPAGSILVTCIGATIGKTGLAQVACSTNQQINSISPAEGVEPEFAYFQVISPQFQEQIKTNASSTTLPILNKSKFSALPFVRCSLPEQQEIVRLLDEQFEAIERNEREIDAALKRSEALRQAILKKAFTGQLVPQDPADEPASELLARLRADRAP